MRPGNRCHTAVRPVLPTISLPRNRSRIIVQSICECLEAAFGQHGLQPDIMRLEGHFCHLLTVECNADQPRMPAFFPKPCNCPVIMAPPRSRSDCRRHRKPREEPAADPGRERRLPDRDRAFQSRYQRAQLRPAVRGRRSSPCPITTGRQRRAPRAFNRAINGRMSASDRIGKKPDTTMPGSTGSESPASSVIARLFSSLSSAGIASRAASRALRISVFNSRFKSISTPFNVQTRHFWGRTR